MRLSHVAVLSMLALSLVVDGLIPFPLPDSGHDRPASPYGEPRGEVMNHADGTGFYLRPGPAAALRHVRPAPPLAQPNMEVSDNGLGIDTAGNGADGGGDRVGASRGPGTVAGVATWYGGPLFQGHPMADGRTFNEWDATIVASNDFPLGTVLEITFSRSITVVVSDRGLLDRGQVDLSRAGFVALMGSTMPGRVAVDVREVP